MRFLCLHWSSVHSSSPAQGISTSEVRSPRGTTQSFLLNFVFVNKSCKQKKERQTLLLRESHLTFNIYNTFRRWSPSHWALLRGSFCPRGPFFLKVDLESWPPASNFDLVCASCRTKASTGHLAQMMCTQQLLHVRLALLQKAQISQAHLTHMSGLLGFRSLCIGPDW